MDQHLEVLGSVPSRTWSTFLTALSSRSLLPDLTSLTQPVSDKMSDKTSDLSGSHKDQNGGPDPAPAEFDIDPEALSDQKRAWQAMQKKKVEAAPMPDVLLEHFLVLGVHPGADLREVEDAFVRNQEAELGGDTCGVPQEVCYMDPQVRWTVLYSTVQ